MLYEIVINDIGVPLSIVNKKLSDATGGMLHHRTMKSFLKYGLSIRMCRLKINVADIPWRG